MTTLKSGIENNDLMDLNEIMGNDIQEETSKKEDLFDGRNNLGLKTVGKVDLPTRDIPYAHLPLTAIVIAAVIQDRSALKDAGVRSYCVKARLKDETCVFVIDSTTVPEKLKQFISVGQLMVFSLKRTEGRKSGTAEPIALAKPSIKFVAPEHHNAHIAMVYTDQDGNELDVKGGIRFYMKKHNETIEEWVEKAIHAFTAGDAVNYWVPESSVGYETRRREAMVMIKPIVNTIANRFAWTQKGTWKYFFNREGKLKLAYGLQYTYKNGDEVETGVSYFTASIPQYIWDNVKKDHVFSGKYIEPTLAMPVEFMAENWQFSDSDIAIYADAFRKTKVHEYLMDTTHQHDYTDHKTGKRVPGVNTILQAIIKKQLAPMVQQFADEFRRGVAAVDNSTLSLLDAPKEGVEYGSFTKLEIASYFLKKFGTDLTEDQVDSCEQLISTSEDEALKLVAKDENNYYYYLVEEVA